MVAKRDEGSQDPAARVRDLINEAIKVGHYQIAISILREGTGKIDHHVETMAFPPDDQVKSVNKIRDMVFELLEGPKADDGKQGPA